MCKHYYEDDRPVEIPKRYLKWSDEKIARVIRIHEKWTRFRNRFNLFSRNREKNLEEVLGYKVYLEATRENEIIDGRKEYAYFK